MMLIILDKDPVEAATILPKSIRHKQLLELMQMLSCVLNFGYDKLSNGKAIKDWISRNKSWVYLYAKTLYDLFVATAKNPKKETKIKYKCLLDLLLCECEVNYEQPTTAVLRYKEGYKCKYPTDTELPIEECVEIYKDYAQWKGWTLHKEWAEFVCAYCGNTDYHSVEGAIKSARQSGWIITRDKKYYCSEACYKESRK